MTSAWACVLVIRLQHRLTGAGRTQRVGSKGPLGDFVRILSGLLSPIILAPSHVGALVRLAGSQQQLLGSNKASVAQEDKPPPRSQENGELTLPCKVSHIWFLQARGPCLRSRHSCGRLHFSDPARYEERLQHGCQLQRLADQVTWAAVRSRRSPALRRTRDPRPLPGKQLPQQLLQSRGRQLHAKPCAASWCSAPRPLLGWSAPLLARCCPCLRCCQGPRM